MHFFKKQQVNFHQLCNYISLPERESKQFGERLLSANFVPYDFHFPFQVAHKYHNFLNLFRRWQFQTKKKERLKEVGTWIHSQGFISRKLKIG